LVTADASDWLRRRQFLALVGGAALVINIKTATALGLGVSPRLQKLADTVVRSRFQSTQISAEVAR
jgi:hypothetical protein